MLEKLKQRLFWIVARTSFTLYGWFPLFGPLRASIGVIRRGDRVLIISRSDGRGLCLPGGIARKGEPNEEALRREVLEETGLNVDRQEFKLRYFSDAEVPCTISVFEVQARGKLKNSWEGSVHWMKVAEFESGMLESQRPALEVIRKVLGE